MPDQKQSVAESAELIFDGFIKYNEAFYRITERARRRFEQRDWAGHQKDIVYRIDLYEKSVRRIVLALRRLLGAKVMERVLWSDVRGYFGDRIDDIPDVGFIKTFFNSVTRRIFGTVGIDPQVEFVTPAPEEEGRSLQRLSLKHYPYWHSMKYIFEKTLTDFSFRIAYKDKLADCAYIAAEVEQQLRIYMEEGDEVLRFEFIDSFFYQSARAYLVGRIILRNQILPIVIALRNDKDGICVDAVLTSEEEVSIVFSYTRSYYFADPSSVMGAVYFLHSILPRKPLDELYTVLGRLRQGKTERYRIFTRHMNNTDHKFVHAAGDKGLVMIVFNLPSYDLVFKIIRDRFGHPKTVTRQDVIDKYKLVSKHDRAGRLIDTQEFRNLEFPVERFAPELLDELTGAATQTVHIKRNKLVIDHVYIERRVRPLNLYINEVNRQEAELAIIDYGQTIKDLAHSNIFPGDLLLKNFGVTKHRRVVFYDYDEVALVTECNFRDIPTPRDDEDTMRQDNWFYVGERDMFPEEFIKFLSMNDHLRSLFLEVHGELLTAGYWREIKERHLSGDISLVVPYYRPVISRRNIAPANPPAV